MTSVQAVGALPPNRARLSTRNALVYAVGELGSNLTWNMISGFILFYYTDVALVPIATLGALLLCTRLLDAFIDPLIGILMDRTRTPLGRARPYLLYGCVPFAVLTVMCFSVPHWSQSAKLIYAGVTFTLVGMLFSVLYIPYGALLPLMTSDPDDKLRIGSWRAMAASLGSIIVYGTMLPLVALIGHGDAQRGFTGASLIMALSTAASLLLVVQVCRERVGAVTPSARQEAVWRGVGEMLRNPLWRIVSAFALLMFIRLGLLVAVTAYYANDVLQRPWAISLMLSSLSVSILIGSAVAKPLIARLGQRVANLIALGAAVVLGLLEGACGTSIYLFGAVFFLANVTLGVTSATIFTMIADSVDEQGRLFAIRNEGLLSASVSFATKVGMALGGSLVAFALAWAHYTPHAVTAAARAQISLVFLLGPAGMAALQMVVIAFHSQRSASQSSPCHPYGA